MAYYIKKPSAAQIQAQQARRQVILDHDVFDTIVDIHISLLYAGKNKTFTAINEHIMAYHKIRYVLQV